MLTLAGKNILLIPGGGPTADAIRTFDKAHGLGEEASHWLALHALALNAHFLVNLFPPGAQVVEGLNAPKRVFSGSARAAAAGFPANVNVAAALSLAGIGPDKTMIDIWADPAMTRNCHSIEVDSDSARFTLSIENIPSENPKTGKNVALSVIAALRKMHAPLAVGT